MRLLGTMRNENGILSIGGVKVTKLKELYGTPLYVMDQKLIEENIIKYKENFSSKKFQTKIIYASKAFLSKKMCRIISSYDLYIDAVSGGELYVIKNSGFQMSKVVMHGNNKSIDELEMCLDYGIGCIVIDNEEEIEKLLYLCNIKNVKANVMIRLNIGIEAHTHEYIKTAKHSSKFGISIYNERLLEIVKKIVESDKINFLGFHSHIGSQIFDVNPFLEEIKMMVDITKKISNELNIEVPEINLGGGFGIYYTNEDKNIEIENFMKKLVEFTEREIEKKELNLKSLAIEPGRSIIGNAGSTLYEIGGIKTTFNGTKYLFVNGGLSDNIRPALYQAKYEAEIANRFDFNEKENVTIAGKCCESGDIIVKDRKISKAKIGDLLIISTTGAYGYSMASNYNRLRKPAVVFVKDGESKLSIKRETFDDMIQNDLD